MAISPLCSSPRGRGRGHLISPLVISHRPIMTSSITQSKEHQTERETDSGTERIWNFLVCIAWNQISSLCLYRQYQTCPVFCSDQLQSETLILFLPPVDSAWAHVSIEYTGASAHARVRPGLGSQSLLRAQSLPPNLHTNYRYLGLGPAATGKLQL